MKTLRQSLSLSLISATIAYFYQSSADSGNTQIETAIYKIVLSVATYLVFYGLWPRPSRDAIRGLLLCLGLAAITHLILLSFTEYMFFQSGSANESVRFALQRLLVLGPLEFIMVSSSVLLIEFVFYAFGRFRLTLTKN